MSSRTAAPSAAPVRARAARASVTSLASSASSSTTVEPTRCVECDVSRLTTPVESRQTSHSTVGGALDEHRADLVAAARRPFRHEREALQRHGGARDRHPAERRGEQATDGLDVLELEPDAEELLDVVDRQP